MITEIWWWREQSSFCSRHIY